MRVVTSALAIICSALAVAGTTSRAPVHMATDTLVQSVPFDGWLFTTILDGTMHLQAADGDAGSFDSFKDMATAGTQNNDSATKPTVTPTPPHSDRIIDKNFSQKPSTTSAMITTTVTATTTTTTTTTTTSDETQSHHHHHHHHTGHNSDDVKNDLDTQSPDDNIDDTVDPGDSDDAIDSDNMDDPVNPIDPVDAPELDVVPTSSALQ